MLKELRNLSSSKEIGNTGYTREEFFSAIVDGVPERQQRQGIVDRFRAMLDSDIPEISHAVEVLVAPICNRNQSNRCIKIFQ